ncbi:uncharacterized protein BXZ73DRAFT_76554 [Epithele typhae]|uniref:uncharacterized protein n=1 Tax=Epithele typhae TaxID=378194 RepID=UPI002008704F|nr:uncharacterized protein BXZ73DRAFT_76554 [Epithele typhae]KAH9936725.1 hypothetical protein BXZ73DRAFT_76554 [Epithele typhae]
MLLTPPRPSPHHPHSWCLHPTCHPPPALAPRTVDLDSPSPAHSFFSLDDTLIMPPMSIEHRNTLHQIMRGPYMYMEVALVCEAIQNGLGGRIKVKKNNGGSLTFPHGCCRFLHRTTKHGRVAGGKGKSGKKQPGNGKKFRSDVVAALGRKLIEALGLDNVQGGFNLQKWNRICARNWNASYYSCSCKYARAGRETRLREKRDVIDPHVIQALRGWLCSRNTSAHGPWPARALLPHSAVPACAASVRRTARSLSPSVSPS